MATLVTDEMINEADEDCKAIYGAIDPGLYGEDNFTPPTSGEACVHSSTEGITCDVSYNAEYSCCSKQLTGKNR